MTPEILLLLKGAFVGASIAAPVGPVAILCIRQTLAYGWLVGIVAGLGTALADGCFGGLAAVGANLVNEALASYGHWFYLIGGGFLLYIGQQIFRSSITKTGKDVKTKSPYVTAFTSTLLLTFASPMTTILFVGMFTTVGVFDAESQNHCQESAWLLSLGVVLGAFLWWVFVTGVVAFLRTKLNFKIFTIINKLSGAAIFTFGLWTISKFF
jgi:threonine/homoserine/homoserine lactone efflux protein